MCPLAVPLATSLWSEARVTRSMGFINSLNLGKHNNRTICNFWHYVLAWIDGTFLDLWESSTNLQTTTTTKSVNHSLLANEIWWKWMQKKIGFIGNGYFNTYHGRHPDQNMASYSLGWGKGKVCIIWLKTLTHAGELKLACKLSFASIPGATSRCKISNHLNLSQIWNT